MKNKNFFVTGIDTNVGKTVASAILVSALGADYWKPIQSGDLNNSDSSTISSLCNNCYIHHESYKLTQPISPHAAATIDNVNIDIKFLKLPKSDNSIIVEGAGGIMVPLNNETLIIDLIKELNIPVILVSKFYLGSINHTLLSIEVLEKKNINIAGIIFNGEKNIASATIIEKYTNLPVITYIPQVATINKEFINKQSKILNKTFLD
jgi:dethiobiotin synthetase